MVIMNLFHTLCLGRRLPAKRISPGCVTAPGSSWYIWIHVLVATYRVSPINKPMLKRIWLWSNAYGCMTTNSKGSSTVGYLKHVGFENSFERQPLVCCVNIVMFRNNVNIVLFSKIIACGANALDGQFKG